VLGILIIVASSLWQMLFVFAPLGYFFWRFVQSFRKISRELKRLESIARSPLLAHISTTLLGLALVRSFGAGEAFKQVNSQWIDKHHKLATFLFNTNRWLGIRLDLLAILVSILTTLLLLLVPIDRTYRKRRNRNYFIIEHCLRSCTGRICALVCPSAHKHFPVVCPPAGRGRNQDDDGRADAALHRQPGP